MPMLVRGLYYAEWDPSRVPMKLNREEFLQRIRREFPTKSRATLSNWSAPLAALRLYITDGEWEDIKALMPKQLAAALP